MSTVRLAAAVLVMLVFLAGEAFAQAAAESVLTHGLSSGAASSLGKTLGSALGNAAGRVGGKLGQQTPSPSRPPAPAGKLNRTAAAQVPPASNTDSSVSGPFIVSIQGESAQSTCASTAKPAEDNSAKPVTPAINPATSSDTCKTAQTQDAQNHPAVVNLPASH